MDPRKEHRFTKRRIGIVLTSLSGGFLVFHLYALWVVVRTFAAGLVWWAEPLVAIGPPLTLAALVHALWRPRQLALAATNAVLLAIYLAVWVPFLASR